MSSHSERNWLVLAHCFNMDGRAASQTITDRIPFLLKKGIVPVVLSAPTGQKDKSFPHFQVLSPAPSGLLFETRQIIEKAFERVKIAKFLKAILTIACLPFYLFEKIFINLDSHWSWFVSAVIKGWLVAGKYKPELIYSTAGPSSTHLAGLLLKKILRIPWIAEIHDPLISEYEEPRYQRHSFAKWLEKQIFNNADAVIYFTEVALQKAVSRTNGQRVGHVLRPGANPPEIEAGVIYEKRNEIHFGHFGSLAQDRNLHGFMEALALVMRKYPEYREKVVLDVFGTNLDDISAQSLVKFELQDVVRVHGRLEYDKETGKSGRQQVVEQMHRSDVLLLVHGESGACAEYIPSKLYEYLLTGRPIVGVVYPQSELAVLLSENGHYIVSSGDIEGLAGVIENLMTQWTQNKQGLPAFKSNNLFTVERTVDEFLSIVETILKH